ncbi:hypothetical protein GARC_2420 [Paraglaciecola arctica BSs20135]|uniref:Uncharacterized protein n=1 Tax=Paraglaciecola arctica BSs20135 TaxID=493475 RepID=K6Y619_9ALTE|nr:hypothetical protein GARC_2420 [Paraglaciecola arctica BSs20135]
MCDCSNSGVGWYGLSSAQVTYTPRWYFGVYGLTNLGTFYHYY